jgi:hypothetical protein
MSPADTPLTDLDLDPSEEALIDQALLQLTQGDLMEASEPPAFQDHTSRLQAEHLQAEEPEPWRSPTLDAMDEHRRPATATVCEHCPNSVWFASPKELKCYCRVMYLVTWSSKDPSQITHCDGELLGQEG